MGPLEGGIQHYAWGSHTYVSTLRGLPRSTQPEAEVWFGDHPVLPSKVTWAGTVRPLGEVIRADAQGVLGADVAHRFGARLPYLLKLLAAETPLSLQAHPSLAQAREGFAREEVLGVPRTAADRNYKDENHKPELLCALTPFEALCGFRTPREVMAIFGALGLDPVRVGLLAGGDDATQLRRAFESQFALSRDERVALCGDVIARARNTKPTTVERALADSLPWLLRVAALYPDDLGIVQMLFLNVVKLAPFEAIYLPAGNMHAYLGGFGIEIMASSDNVLRGGLTPKHVDERELMHVLDFLPRADWRVEPMAGPRSVEGATKYVYSTPTAEFELSRIVLAPAHSIAVSGRGPHVLVATRGALEITRGDERALLAPGEGVFVEHGEDIAVRASGNSESEAFSAGVPFPPTE